ncbi:MAG: hypothetical protein R3F34_16795 [Planctomycetota bacterium]
MLKTNLVVRSTTKEVGLIRMDHRWRFDMDRPLPEPQGDDAEGA